MQMHPFGKLKQLVLRSYVPTFLRPVNEGAVSDDSGTMPVMAEAQYSRRFNSLYSLSAYRPNLTELFLIGRIIGLDDEEIAGTPHAE